MYTINCCCVIVNVKYLLRGMGMQAITSFDENERKTGLHVLFNFNGDDDLGYVGYTSEYFDDVFVKDWLSDKFVQHIIEEIDDTSVENDAILYNDVLGYINPRELSTGCKTLILIYKLNLHVKGSRMGDNCIPLLLEIAEKKEVYISLSRSIPIERDVKIICDNDDTVITTYKEFLNKHLDELCKFKQNPWEVYYGLKSKLNIS